MNRWDGARCFAVFRARGSSLAREARGVRGSSLARETPPMPPTQTKPTEVLPKTGLIYSEKGALSETLCKPKLMPIKSLTLEKLEQMEANLLKQPNTQPVTQEPVDDFEKAEKGIY